jgi:hypothetical protein
MRIASPSLPRPIQLTSIFFVSGSTISTIGTRLTTIGTSTMAPCLHAPVVPPRFEPPVAPLPAPTIPPEFLPWAALTIVPHAAHATPTADMDDLPPRAWPASPVAYSRRLLQPVPMSTTPPPPLRHDQGVVVHVTPLDNPHQMVTRGNTGSRVLIDHLVLTVMTYSPLLSSILTSARAVLADPNWCAAMEEEYGALMSNGT